MSNCLRGDKREDELPSLLPSAQTMHTLSYLLHLSVIFSLHPFSQQQWHLTIHLHSQNSSNHSPAPTIVHTPSNSTSCSLLCPQSIWKWVIHPLPHPPHPPHPLLCYHTLHTSHHLPFFISSYPLISQLNQSTSLTTTLHTNLTYLTTHGPSFDNLYHFNMLYVYASSLSISFLSMILFFNLTNNPGPLSSSNFFLKTSYSSYQPIPPSSLSFHHSSPVDYFPSLLDSTFVCFLCFGLSGLADPSPF